MLNWEACMFSHLFPPKPAYSSKQQLKSLLKPLVRDPDIKELYLNLSECSHERNVAPKYVWTLKPHIFTALDNKISNQVAFIWKEKRPFNQNISCINMHP